ncbi:TNFAIP3-interacting protein 3-like [Thunnus thynnus]|uniref:TNFAIP3-interacting protein 3-like n=1 Tax=Thunnus thynnus TaxID=8237 RepID=UPI003528C7AD
MERSQASKAAPTEGTQNDQKHVHRLYPSLPNVHTYEVCVPNGSSRAKLEAAAVYRPESLLGDTQSEVSATNSDTNMKAQILIMEKQRQELLSINEKWAKEYRIMAQYYQEKVRDLKAILQHDNFHFKEEEKGERPITLHKKVKIKTLKDEENTQAGNGDVSSEVLKAEREVEELRARNNTLTQRGQHQQEEIRRLNKALEETLHTTQRLDASSETLQDIWKHQAQIYKEDFMKERRDRENLKGKCLELEKRLKKAHNELHVLKSQGTSTRPPQPALECTCRHTTDQHHIRPQRRYTLDEKR